MKNLLHNIISKLCFASFLGIVVSCTTDDFSENRHYDASEVGGDVNLSLNVSIAGTSGISRTRDGEETDDNSYYFEGTDNEFELIKTLRIIIVRPDYTVEVNQFIDLTTPVSTLTNDDLKGNPNLADGLKFRLSTTQGRVDNEAMTCTEKKRVYLIANEATLGNTDFKSNFTGESQKIPDLLKELTPAYYPTQYEVDKAKEEDKDVPIGNRGSKLDPYEVQKWIIYNEWPESGDPGTDVNDLLALPIIDNDVSEDKKSYIPMTEFFDIDVVSTWNPKKTGSGSASGSGNGSGSGSGSGSGTGGNDNQVIDNDDVPIAIPEQTADLFVTRNFVKFQFTASSETESFKIKSITFEKLMQQEYLFPNNVVYGDFQTVNGVTGREILSFSTPGFSDNNLRTYRFIPKDFVYPAITTPADPDNPEPPANPEVAIYNPALYFCETQNILADENNKPIYNIGITVQYKDGEKYELTADFDIKQLLNLPSIPRNTIVKVNFTINDRKKIDCTVTLVPYISVSLDPIFGNPQPYPDDPKTTPEE